MRSWFDGDYPQTLRDVLGLIGRDAAPMLAALGQAFDAWATTQAESGMELPRGVGEYQSELRGVTVTAVVRSYVPWKLQRLREAAEVAPAPARERVETALTGSGCGVLLTRPGATRLEKRKFQLVVA
jgi:hypothetical protein